MLKTCWENIRRNGPLIHNITNYVTVNDVANVLLACGGSPIMSDEPEEVEEITTICGGLNLNIGTLNRRTIPAMLAAGRRANALGHPVVLDPAGAGASALRTETAAQIMREVQIAAVRCNISELKALINGSGTTRGVDADITDAVTEANLSDGIAYVKSAASQLGTTVAVTGAIDLVTDGKQCFVIRNGRPEMGRITGTGCQLSALTAAALTANPDQPLEAAAAAVAAMGLAGETGWTALQPSEGNSTYRNRIIDAIYHMNGETLEKGARYEIR